MNSSLPLIGVIDLCGGRAVHAIAGRRQQYRDVVATDVSAGDAVGLANRYRRFGIRSLYIADLGAILGQSPHLDLVGELCDSTANVLIDAGAFATEFKSLVAERQARLVLPTESFATVDEWASLCERLDGSRVTLGIDLSGSQIRCGGGLPPAASSSDSLLDNVSPWIERARSLGVQSLVVLDLAFVGTRQGAGTSHACRSIAGCWPTMELISGGGIHHAADVQSLLQAGCDQVLVATALQDDATAIALIDELAS